MLDREELFSVYFLVERDFFNRRMLCSFSLSEREKLRFLLFNITENDCKNQTGLRLRV